MNHLSFEDAEISDLGHSHAMPVDGELHVWSWSTTAIAEDTLQVLDALYSLDEEEIKRYDRFATPELRRRFLTSHAAARQVLAGYLGASASDLAFTQTSAGKPYLADVPLRFNLSHSADANLLALATAEVGVDIERVRSVTSLSSLAARHFARAELEAMRNSDDPPREFFSTWTRKEAIIKLVGLGLAAGVQELDTSTIRDGIAIPPAWEYPANRCWVADLNVDLQHAAAVAIGDKPQTIRLFRVA